MEFCGQNFAELERWLRGQKELVSHASKIFIQIYRKGLLDFQCIEGINKRLKKLLIQDFVFPELALKEKFTSKCSPTERFLWQAKDGLYFESVKMAFNSKDYVYSPTSTAKFRLKRLTLCLSSQIGCKRGCYFCASGQKGFVRNLSTSEIVEQLLHVNAYLRQEDKRVSHLVFMGMGEPLDNFNEVKKAIEIINHCDGSAISQNRMSISTVGVLEQIEKLLQSDLKVGLCLSLHAPNQKLREKIMPSAKNNPLKQLLEIVENYRKSGRKVAYEYTLLKGVNDQIEHAKELLTLFQGKRAFINLIPYNSIEQSGFTAPDRDAIAQFGEVLIEGGLKISLRHPMGCEIAAGCGQLALKNNCSLCPAD